MPRHAYVSLVVYLHGFRSLPHCTKARLLAQRVAIEHRQVTCWRPQLPIALPAAKGDEVLDWQEMVTRYPGATLRPLDGSDHVLSDF